MKPADAPVAPFRFAADFASGAEPPASVLLSLTPEDLAGREAAAYARGHSDGAAAEAAGLTARLAAISDHLAAQFETVEAAIAAHRAEAQDAAARLAFALARKLAGRLVEAEPVAAVMDAFSALLTDLAGEPAVLVRVAPEIAEAVDTQLRTLIAGRSTTLAITVEADAGIAAGDCAIEWRDGGLVRDQTMALARLDALVDSALSKPSDRSAP